MVSRRKILSRSRDDLNLEAPPEEEEDVWYNRDKLYRVSGYLKYLSKLATAPNRFDKINKMREFGEEGHQVTSVSVWEGNKNIGDQLSKIFIFLTISVSII